MWVTQPWSKAQPGAGHGFSIISNATDKVQASVEEGESRVTPLQVSGLPTSMLTSRVEAGEETARLPVVLPKLADVYDDEVDNAVGAVTGVLSRNLEQLIRIRFFTPMGAPVRTQ